MKRVIAFIDGFNIYHSLRDKKLHYLKWLNYWNLSEAFVSKSSEKLVAVYYFTAFAVWDAGKVERHKRYINALQAHGVTPIYGKFKTVTKTCLAQCHQQYKTFEEKETDINIAVTLLLDAFNDKFDKALLFSGDSDMIAGIKAMKEIAPNKHIKAIIPFGRSSFDLTNHCDSVARIKKAHLERHQFPDVITLKNGGKISKPTNWV